MREKISFVLTSCGRVDLLDKTLESSFKFNNYPLEALYLTEDSVDKDVYEKIKKKWELKLIKDGAIKLDHMYYSPIN